MPFKTAKKRNAYMKPYMREYRKGERELLTMAKAKFGWATPKQKQRGKK
jgi:hypothetical protein